MKRTVRVRPGRVRGRCAGMGCSAIAIVVLGGCRAYESSPLDLRAHRQAIAQRAVDFEPIGAFASRLNAAETGAPVVFDARDGLTAAEAEVVALFYNPELRAARLAAGVALASFENAGLWEDPEFGFDGAQILSPGSLLEFGLMVRLTLPVSGRLEVEKDRAGAVYEAELRRIVDREWGVRASVRRAWAAWQTAEERVRLLREVVEGADAIAEIAGRLEESGELSRVEARLFRVELAERRAELVEGAYRARRARWSLLGLMGLGPDAEVVFVPGYPSVHVEEDAEEEPMERLLAANPSLAVRAAEYRVAEESLRLEIRKQYPDITIGSGYGDEDDHRFLFGVSVPIPILNANRAGIAEAHARRESARALAEAELERLMHRLAEAEALLATACAQRVRYENEIVPLLEEQGAELERIVDAGEVDVLMILETLKRHASVRQRLLDLRCAEVEARVTIAELLGPRGGTEPAPVETVGEEGGES